MMAIINGQRSLAYFNGDQIVGYSTQDEINQEFYKRDGELPNYKLNF